MERTSQWMALVTSIVLAAQGCGPSRELSRSQARELILKARPDLAGGYTALPVHLSKLGAGEKLGLWTKRGELAPEVKEYASAVKLPWPIGLDEEITLLTPYRIEFEITGIADVPMSDGSAKLVQFQWRYEDLSPFARAFASNGGTGEAVARRFDDGWRIVADGSGTGSVGLEQSREPYPEDAEAAAFIKDLAQRIRDRRSRESERRQAAERERIERLQHVLEESKRPTKVLGEFTDARSGGKKIIVTDVAVLGIALEGIWRMPRITGSESDRTWYCYLRGSMASTLGRPISGTYRARAMLNHEVDLGFATEDERDRFVEVLKQAGEDWWSRYRDTVVAADLNNCEWRKR